ncbi:hypothetical protein MTCD1_01130 [Colwellia marinimaniae]|uniref:Secreted protein n=1 Tax=Colwellia marinimaniae TaxID=1513592 RepID=A0ABQ0MTI5_9GAMM|nr:hypothetical protein MTCD1_01130 [Colwellia marinimaniae]
MAHMKSKIKFCLFLYIEKSTFLFSAAMHQAIIVNIASIFDGDTGRLLKCQNQIYCGCITPKAK